MAQTTVRRLAEMIIPVAGPNFVQGAWAGYSGRFMFTAQDYERQWELEGPHLPRQPAALWPLRLNSGSDSP